MLQFESGRCLHNAVVAESADAQDLKSCDGNIVPVQFWSTAPKYPCNMDIFLCLDQWQVSLAYAYGILNWQACTLRDLMTLLCHLRHFWSTGTISNILWLFFYALFRRHVSLAYAYGIIALTSLYASRLDVTFIQLTYFPICNTYFYYLFCMICFYCIKTQKRTP